MTDRYLRVPLEEHGGEMSKGGNRANFGHSVLRSVCREAAVRIRCQRITCGIESHEGMVKRYTGGCLCGRVRFEASTPVSNLCYCHCNSCRRAAGAPLVAWGTFVSAGFHITRGELTEYRSSPPVLRGFCAACGGALTYRHEARAREIDVTLASLDEAASLAPQVHVWVGEKLPWVVIADGLPQFVAQTTGARAL